MTDRTHRRPWLHSRWLSPIALLIAWEAASRLGLIPAHTLAAPSTVLATMAGMTASGELPSSLLVSFGRAGLGLAIGISLGLVLGLLAGLSRRGEALVDPL